MDKDKEGEAKVDKTEGEELKKEFENEKQEDETEKRLSTGYRCKNGWFELRARGKLPEKRSHHSSVVYNGGLYIFGGEDSREGKYDSLWRLNLDEFIELGAKAFAENQDEENKDLKDEEEPQDNSKVHWELLATSGARPGPISRHSTVVKGDEMYLFGGSKDDGDCNGELFCLNLKSLEWRVVHSESDDKAKARDDHSMASADDGFYIFGGFVEGKRMNDLYKFTYESKKWECLWAFKEVNEFSSEEKQKECPCPRSGQAIAYYSDKVYLFGGRNDYNDRLNDTWEFTVSSKRWEKIKCEESPIGRSSHTLIVDSNRMILFGGIVEITKEINEIEQFDFSSKKWSTIDDKSEQHKHENASSPTRNKEKMNETAPVRSDNDIKNVTLKRETNNKSMKKIHSKASLIEPSEEDPNFHLLKPIPKQNKKKSDFESKQEEYNNIRNEINTPTTENLRNTFVIKNQNEGFDQYYTQMKKRKGESKLKSLFMQMFNQCLKPCDRPTARDGHTCSIYKNKLYIFGGDRHHMTYNDTFSIDLA